MYQGLTHHIKAGVQKHRNLGLLVKSLNQLIIARIPLLFNDYHESPYMDKTLRIRESMQESIAAVCHVDGTGRLQTVKEQWNPRYYQLIT
jgi:hypothetical protein